MTSGEQKEPRGSGRLPSFDPNPSAKFGSELLRDAGVPHALIGRIAMWTMLPAEQHELTKDVDFAVPKTASGTIAAALAQQDLVARPLPIGGQAVRTDTLRIDFIDRRDGGLDGLFAEAIDAAAKAGTTTRVSSLEIPVVTPEYLLATKVVAADRKDQRDAIRLLRSIARLDLRAARAIVAQHGGPAGANLFDTLAREAGHPDARPAYRNGGSD